VARDLDAVAPILLREDVADVAFDGADAQVKFGGDLFIAQAVGDEPRDPRFSFREVLDRRVACRRAFIPLRGVHEAREFDAGALHPPEDVRDNGEQFLRVERFREVSVNARAKSRDAVFALVLCGEKDDGDERGARVRTEGARVGGRPCRACECR
jgi:hypothetical protein